jgi:hypothetical protein
VKIIEEQGMGYWDEKRKNLTQSRKDIELKQKETKATKGKPDNWRTRSLSLF